MTSNLGAREAMRSRTRNYTSFSNTVMEYVRRYLRPELLGRIEGVGSPFVFRRLEEPQQRELAGFHVRRVLERMQAAGHSVRMGSDAFEYVTRALWRRVPAKAVTRETAEFSRIQGSAQLIGLPLAAGGSQTRLR